MGLATNNIGVGFNLRLEFIDELLEKRPKADCIQLISDNFFDQGPHIKKLEKLREEYDLSFHCVGMNIGGVDPLSSSYFDKLNELINNFEPLNVSDHLCFQMFQGQHHHDLLPIPFSHESFDNVMSRVDDIQNKLKRRILLENLSSYIEVEEGQEEEINFLNELSQKTGCGILLDLNNIFVNNLNFNLDIEKYIAAINWEHVVELHVAGHELINNMYVDTHGADISEEVKQKIASLRDKLEGKQVFYEQDNNLESFENFYANVNELRKALR